MECGLNLNLSLLENFFGPEYDIFSKNWKAFNGNMKGGGLMGNNFIDYLLLSVHTILFLETSKIYFTYVKELISTADYTYP